jgi:hypothetical protein
LGQPGRVEPASALHCSARTELARQRGGQTGAVVDRWWSGGGLPSAPPLPAEEFARLGYRRGRSPRPREGGDGRAVGHTLARPSGWWRGVVRAWWSTKTTATYYYYYRTWARIVRARRAPRLVASCSSDRNGSSHGKKLVAAAWGTALVCHVMDEREVAAAPMPRDGWITDDQ